MERQNQGQKQVSHRGTKTRREGQKRGTTKYTEDTKEDQSQKCGESSGSRLDN